MFSPAVYALISVIAVSLLSFVSLLAMVFKIPFGPKVMNFFVSFAAGALLGDVFIHLLPEVAETGLSLNISLWILLTIIVFFMLEKYLHWHHHHWNCENQQHKTRPFVFLNLIGDGMHNFIDGLIIGSTYLLDVKLGLATTLAVALHEIPQEIGDFAVLVYGGLSKFKALIFNFLSALTAVLGTVIALSFQTSDKSLTILGAVAIGSFLYIATADLIPEIHREQKKTSLQLASFGLGIAIMFLLLFLE